MSLGTLDRRYGGEEPQEWQTAGTGARTPFRIRELTMFSRANCFSGWAVSFMINHFSGRRAENSRQYPSSMVSWIQREGEIFVHAGRNWLGLPPMDIVASLRGSRGLVRDRIFGPGISREAFLPVRSFLQNIIQDRPKEMITGYPKEVIFFIPHHQTKNTDR